MSGRRAIALRGAALNESPSEKEGKLRCFRQDSQHRRPLNESPSEKEGK